MWECSSWAIVSFFLLIMPATFRVIFLLHHLWVGYAPMFQHKNGDLSLARLECFKHQRCFSLVERISPKMNVSLCCLSRQQHVYNIIYLYLCVYNYIFTADTNKQGWIKVSTWRFILLYSLISIHLWSQSLRSRPFSPIRNPEKPENTRRPSFLRKHLTQKQALQKRLIRVVSLLNILFRLPRGWIGTPCPGANWQKQITLVILMDLPTSSLVTSYLSLDYSQLWFERRWAA